MVIRKRSQNQPLDTVKVADKQISMALTGETCATHIVCLKHWGIVNWSVIFINTVTATGMTQQWQWRSSSFNV